MKKNIFRFILKTICFFQKTICFSYHFHREDSGKFKLVQFILILILSTLFSSCKSGDGNNANPLVTPGNPIEIPSFALEPLSHGTRSSANFVEQQNTKFSLIEVPDIIKIVCASQAILLKDSKAQKMLTNELDFLDYLNIFYGFTNFYDCSIRYRAQEYGIEELPSGQYVSFHEDDDNPENNTRYVSWIYETNNNAPTVERAASGKIVNLHLQENKIRKKIRIDLSNDGGSRVVDNLIRFLSESGLEFYIRVLFKEIINENGEVVEHRMGARYYSSAINANDVVAIAGVVKAGVGSVIFLKSCDDTDDPHAVCELSSGDYDTKFYDTSGTELDSAPDGMPTTPEEIGTDYTDYMINNFYGEETEDDYFEPSFEPDREAE